MENESAITQIRMLKKKNLKTSLLLKYFDNYQCAFLMQKNLLKKLITNYQLASNSQYLKGGINVS